ncbi:hypothetical protein [Variovorax sp. KK3]|uniref:hypothetical protein n=1 Tax=Variovorax sp. KK3 TaxID=1855728 RepID=UPI0015C35B93|nr:hypothetical protein [Variovorax sp. KK3]
MAAAAHRVARRLVVVCMIVCLPLQAASAIVAGLLGPRHSHAVNAPDGGAHDPMAGWRDFRRVQHDELAVAAARDEAAHVFAHEAGVRHHHAHDDASVMLEEPPGLEAGLAADVAQGSASFLFLAAASGERIPVPTATADAAWATWTQAAMPPAHVRRIERPPCRA